jgi:hypothetical protein
MQKTKATSSQRERSGSSPFERKPFSLLLSPVRIGSKAPRSRLFECAPMDFYYGEFFQHIIVKETSGRIGMSSSLQILGYLPVILETKVSFGTGSTVHFILHNPHNFCHRTLVLSSYEKEIIDCVAIVTIMSEPKLASLGPGCGDSL